VNDNTPYGPTYKKKLGQQKLMYLVKKIGPDTSSFVDPIVTYKLDRKYKQKSKCILFQLG
jgi:hypothetical protein